jgi:hypothetical protein
MGNYHVPFWRAVERVTSSLTLIIRDEGLRILLPRTWRGNLAVQRTREFDLWNGG